LRFLNNISLFLAATDDVLVVKTEKFKAHIVTDADGCEAAEPVRVA